MRLATSMIALTMVLAVTSCDSSTSSGSSSPLVGTWEMKDSGSHDTMVQTLLGVDSNIIVTYVETAKYTFSGNGNLAATISGKVVDNGIVVLDIDTTLTGTWKASATQLFQTKSDSTDTTEYAISGDTLKQTGPNSTTGTDTTFVFIRQ